MRADVEPLVIGALVKRLTRPDAAKLLRKKVYDAVDGLTPDWLRAVINAIMTVTVAPVGRGGYV